MEWTNKIENITSPAMHISVKWGRVVCPLSTLRVVGLGRIS